MARVKITDLPIDQKISKEELKNVRGGGKVVMGVSTPPTLLAADPPAGGFTPPIPYPNIKGGSGGIKPGGKRKSTYSPSTGDEAGSGGVRSTFPKPGGKKYM